MESEDWLNSRQKLHQYINNFKDYYKSWKHEISSTSKVLTIWIPLSFKVPSCWCSYIFAAAIKSCSVVNLLVSFCAFQFLSVFLLHPVLVWYCSFPLHIYDIILTSPLVFTITHKHIFLSWNFSHLQVLLLFLFFFLQELCKIHACSSYVF